jgi:glyoxylase I family protein
MHTIRIRGTVLQYLQEELPLSITIESAVPLLAVFDVPRSIAFYRNALGFEVVNTSRPFTDAKDDYGWAMLRLTGVELMLNNMYEDNLRPSEPDQARVSAHADTIIYFACRDVEGVYATLSAQGIAASEPKVAYYGMKQTYVTDPDGYTLCFQWPVGSN